MSHMNCVDGDRARMALALDILEYAAARLDLRSYVPMSVLTDVVAFIDALEEVAFEAHLTAPAGPDVLRDIDRQSPARVPLEGMRQSLRALDEGEAAAAIRFVRFARDYVALRRAHLRADARLFAQPVPVGRREPDADVHTPRNLAAARLYQRLIAAVAALDIGAGPSSANRSHRVRSSL